MKINLNTIVRVKLKPEGFAILKAKWDAIQAKYPEMKDYTPPKLDDEGYYRTELWSLMRDFGPHIGMGLKPPMEMNIIVPDPAGIYGLEPSDTSLRDQFAAQAMNGIISRERNDINGVHVPGKVAYMAFEFADAMLREWKNRP